MILGIWLPFRTKKNFFKLLTYGLLIKVKWLNLLDFKDKENKKCKQDQYCGNYDAKLYQ